MLSLPNLIRRLSLTLALGIFSVGCGQVPQQPVANGSSDSDSPPAASGSADVSTSLVELGGSLAGDVVGTQEATAVVAVGGVASESVASGATLANGATSLNTVGAIVRRDASGNFSAGTITATLNGNAASATTAATAASSANFSGALEGDVAGTQGATVVSKVGGATAAQVASGATAANGATDANTASTIVKRDASGNFSAGIISAITRFVGNLTGNVSGNADTATTAASAVVATSFTGTLDGEVTGTQAATTVSKVGGVTAAEVAAGANLANGSTSANTSGTIVKRDGSGNIAVNSVTASGGIQFSDGTVQTTSASSIGSVQLFAGSVPAGWLPLDGRSLDRSAYPALFASLGTTYGSVSSSEFSLPESTGTPLLKKYRYFRLRIPGATGGAQQICIFEIGLKWDGAWRKGAMSSNAEGTIGGLTATLTASTEHAAAYSAWYAFRGDKGTYGPTASHWCTNAGSYSPAYTSSPENTGWNAETSPQFVEIDFGTNKIAITGYQVWGGYFTGSSWVNLPTSYFLQASDDRSTWTTISASHHGDGYYPYWPSPQDIPINSYGQGTYAIRAQ